MRDFTKSILSFSWALSVFGVQQMANMLSPSKTMEALDNVTEATKREFSGVTEASFQAGDNLQRRLVDLTAGMFSPQMFNPNSWIKLTSDLAQQTIGALGQVIPKGPGAQSQATGWGPVPPPGK
jgi:hypothetical protein